MNPRAKRLVQQGVAVALYVIALLLVILAFVPIQYPSWWPSGFAIQLPYISWWPVVVGMAPSSHYSARFFLTIAFGLTIFLPQVETTFVSLMRRSSPIGAPYVDRRDFTCPLCGRVNRPGVQYCVKCGSQISKGTRAWAKPIGTHSWLMSCLKTSLLVSVILAFFLGIFDLTLYSALTSRSGGNGFVVFLGTMLSVLPSVAGYLALKEGSFRKYSSLKKFDQLVFGNVAWFILGIYSLLLATLILFSPWPPAFAGTVLLLLMQLILGVLMILHPILRGRLSAPNVTYPY